MHLFVVVVDVIAAAGVVGHTFICFLQHIHWLLKEKRKEDRRRTQRNDRLF